MAKFPQIEFETFDGRQAPFTKPQHYKKGSTTETELTGHDNPLPTADYGMTAGGLWIPKRVSDEGAQHTQVTGSNVEDGLPVKDSQVINELEEIRMSQSVIANKVSESPIEEIELFKDLVLEPGQTVSPTTQILKGFDYFILAHNGKHTAENPVDVTVSVRYRASNNTWLSATIILDNLKGHYRVSDRIEINTPQVYITFKNNTDIAMTLNNIFIFKVK